MRRDPRFSKRTRNLILAAIIVLATAGTLSSVPIGAQPEKAVRIPLRYTNVTKAFASLDPLGTIPKNILAATVVPSGSAVIAKENLDNQNGPFDRSVTFLDNVSKASLVSFEIAALHHFGWVLRQNTQTAGVVTYYAQKAGGDGLYWEMSAAISSTTVVALSQAGAQHHTTLTIRLLIESFS